MNKKNTFRVNVERKCFTAIVNWLLEKYLQLLNENLYKNETKVVIVKSF